MLFSLRLQCQSLQYRHRNKRGFRMAKSFSAPSKRESKRNSNTFFTFSENGSGCSKKIKMTDFEEANSLESLPKSCPKNSAFVALHLGVGKYSQKKEEDYRLLCKQAISDAVKVLHEGGSAATAVTNITKMLEDCGFVNAGRGSNLTYEETVECDAAFMNGNNYYGAVGAMPGIPNPIMVAKKLADLQEEKPLLSCGRVPPNFLVGTGARDWAQSNGIAVCDGQELISKKARSTYRKHIDNVHKSEKCNHVNDTVGAIALDQCGNVAATVSSGGHWLKFPGRIGHAPIYGCGCWASNSKTENDSSVALSVSGSGEILSKLHLAQTCGRELKKSTYSVEDLSSLIQERMAEIKAQNEPAYVGLIALNWDGSHGEFIWGHNTESFVVAYGGSSFKNVKVNFTKSSRPSGGNMSLDAILFR